jgi:hypothetical protein
MPVMLLPAVLAGGAEWLAHLVALSVFLVGLVSCSALALRLGMSTAGACWVTLLVGTSPAVLGMATTSMPDVPAMSFGALAAERMLAFRMQPSPSKGIGAMLALVLAALSRPHLAALFVCLLPLLLDEWPSGIRRLRAAALDRSFFLRLTPLGGAIALLALLNYVMRDPLTGDNIAQATWAVMQIDNLGQNLANLPAQWVLSFPLGLAWVALHGRRMLASPWCRIAAVAGLGLGVLVSTANDHWERLPWQAPVTALGMAVLADIVTDAWRRRDLVDISLGAWLLIAWPAAFYSQLPPKYLVPSAPAMALLIVRHAEAAHRRLLARGVLGFAALASLVLGALIARADAALAEVGRTGGLVVAEEIRRGERVWHDSGLGFSWYAMRAGARPMTVTAPMPAAGDIVVRAQSQGVVKRCRQKALVRQIVFDEPGGRVLLGAAGFFSNAFGFGMLPWTWSDREFGRIEVWRITGSCEPDRGR